MYGYLVWWEHNPSRQNYVMRKAVYIKLVRKFKKKKVERDWGYRMPWKAIH